MAVRAFPILPLGMLVQHLICPLHITIMFNLYALMKLVIEGGIIVTAVVGGVGHAIGVVKVINAVARAGKRDHAPVMKEMLLIMCVLKDIKLNFLI
tara:strand:- start:31 stop:318 length:288 start_codon:yes stop_codon:yes gene_type:complete